MPLAPGGTAASGGRGLQRAEAALRADKEFVLAAVRANGCDLQFASEALRRDPDVVLAAVRKDARLQNCNNVLISPP